MNYTQILDALQKASAFDLYRLRAAIDIELERPRWVMSIQAQLRPGQEITYFNPGSNRLIKAVLLEFRRKNAAVKDLDTGKSWLIPYAAINLDGADVEIREQPQEGLSRQSLSIGDLVGFMDAENQQQCGRIIRLNDRTVTLDAGSRRWRVSYSLLHRVVDIETE